MAKNVKLTVDGIEFKAPEGMNLIDAAELAGVHIPNLCYLKGMKGIGACRLCMVNIEGGRGPVIACNTKVKEGMVVVTDTEELQKGRRFVIDLILSMHPLDCMTCAKGGICNLQRYSYNFDMQESSFQRKKFGHPVDLKNPFIRMSPDYCILCGKCVRICKEQDTNVLEFMGRGVGAKVTTVVDRSLNESDCTFCGSCIDVCPVNAIMENDRVRKGREWEYEKKESICLLCGNSCDIKVKTRDNDIMKIRSGAEKGSEVKYICVYGRFGYDYLESEERLTSPMKRVKGELVETSWEDALSIVADNFKKAGKSVGIASVASLTNEDALTLKYLAEDSIKTKDFDTTLSLYATPEIMINSQSALLRDSDLVMVVGINPSQRERILPALNVSIRRKVARGGKLIDINDSETKLSKITDMAIRSEETAALKALIKAAMDKGLKGDKKLAEAVKDATVTEEIEKAAQAFVDAQHPIVFVSPALFDAASNISLLKGHVIAVAYEANAKGVAHVGLHGKGKSYRDIVSGGTKALYAIGEIPLKNRPDCDFLVVQNSHITQLAKYADVLLPSATYLETAGTIIDFKGRLKHMPHLIDPKGNAQTHRSIFKKLAKKIGTPIESAKDADIKAAAAIEPAIKLRAFEKQTALDVPPEMLMESVNESLLNSARLVWLKETEKVTVGK